MTVKVRYVCGHEVDFETEVDGKANPITLREQRLAKEKLKCPACRHDTVRVQLTASKRLRKWK